MKIKDKVAVVTGGSRGLGKRMAQELAANGADVIVTYRSREDEARKVVGDIEAMGRRAACLQLDTAKAATFGVFASQLAGELNRIFDRADFDCLINNAGIDLHTMFGETTEEQFDALMNVHLKGVYFLTQTLAPRMADGGRIVCVSTGLTRFAIPGYGAYAAMKGGIEVLVKYWAKELGPRRITVNCVAPGAIETDFTAAAFENNAGLRDFIASQTALGRVGQPGDIGGVVAMLCSEEAGWINAQRIEVSGGMFL